MEKKGQHIFIKYTNDVLLFHQKISEDIKYKKEIRIIQNNKNI